MKNDLTKITKNSAIKEFASISSFGILFLILVTSIVGAVYFANKNDQLQGRLGEKKERVLYFKESLILLIIPVVFAGFLNFLIKSGLFAMKIDILAGNLKIPFHVVFTSSIYILIVALFGVSLSFLFQITMKPILTASLYPLFIFESFILIFGVSNLFVSEKIPALMEFSNFTSGLVLKYLNMFTSDLRVEMLGVQTFLITILGFIAGTVACLAGSSRFLVTYKEKTLTHSYRSTFLRRLIFLVLVTLFTMYLSIAAFGGYSMLVMGALPLDKAFEYTGIISIVLIPSLTVLFEYLYMRRNNLIVKKEKKTKEPKQKKRKNNKGNVQIKENVENNSQNIDVEINIDVKVNENNLESKGIIKETVKTSYIPKLEENLESITKTNFSDVFENKVEEISKTDESGFEELFFDEDIKIKENKKDIVVENNEILNQEILHENNSDLDQSEEVDSAFFTTTEENK